MQIYQVSESVGRNFIFQSPRKFLCSSSLAWQLLWLWISHYPCLPFPTSMNLDATGHLFYSLSLPFSAVPPNDFCSSQCLVSSVGPLPSIASMVLSQLRPACSSHVPVNASSSFKDNPLPIPLWYSCGYRSLEKFC